jgi:hypothetical protein
VGDRGVLWALLFREYPVSARAEAKRTIFDVWCGDPINLARRAMIKSEVYIDRRFS